MNNTHNGTFLDSTHIKPSSGKITDPSLQSFGKLKQMGGRTTIMK